ncbi:dTDP-4-dehydrorhamnose reductase [Sphingomonas parva]|uniref:dTDP-4-dehydrorhamnose reductase n=1 Tax=Sphingomonas parva TaxID=2555898 RepID=A0A4Y8ZWY7_9SPHN|nr:dTDP-4-dehydrorhamnose reductase [Sphingomonas parva]TFI59902.1 dTDP-4-dehydrorhamnose reductase [Sphingomonas parva]
MKILVTGRAGQLALSLAERASYFPGIELVFVGRPELDLEDPTSLERAIAGARPDVVLNAAAYTAVDQAESDIDTARKVNAEAAGYLGRAARAAGARMIQISTDYVFDGEAAEPYSEDAAIAPINIYGRTKAEGEAAVREALEEHIIVRTSWVFSPFGKNFVRTMLSVAQTRETLTVVDDQIGCPSSALDLADGILSMIARWQRDPRHGLGRTYHLVGGGSCSWADFARQIFATSAAHGGPTAQVTGVRSAQWPTPARRPRNSRLDTSRFIETFGYRPPHWRDATAQVVARLLAQN